MPPEQQQQPTIMPGGPGGGAASSLVPPPTLRPPVAGPTFPAAPALSAGFAPPPSVSSKGPGYPPAGGTSSGSVGSANFGPSLHMPAVAVSPSPRRLPPPQVRTASSAPAQATAPAAATMISSLTLGAGNTLTRQPPAMPFATASAAAPPPTASQAPGGAIGEWVAASPSLSPFARAQLIQQEFQRLAAQQEEACRAARAIAGPPAQAVPAPPPAGNSGRTIPPVASDDSGLPSVSGGPAGLSLPLRPVAQPPVSTPTPTAIPSPQQQQQPQLAMLPPSYTRQQMAQPPPQQPEQPLPSAGSRGGRSTVQLAFTGGGGSGVGSLAKPIAATTYTERSTVVGGGASPSAIPGAGVIAPPSQPPATSPSPATTRRMLGSGPTATGSLDGSSSGMATSVSGFRLGAAADGSGGATAGAVMTTMVMTPQTGLGGGTGVVQNMMVTPGGLVRGSVRLPRGHQVIHTKSHVVDIMWWTLAPLVRGGGARRWQHGPCGQPRSFKMLCCFFPPPSIFDKVRVGEGE